MVDGLQSFLYQEAQVLKVSLDVNSEYFCQAPLEIFEESNFHYCCLCSPLINSTRSLESPAAQKIEPQPGSEELTQSGHELLFKQGLAMTHKKRSLVFEIQSQ